MTDDDVAAVIALERRLLDPDVRADPAAVAALLDDDFREFGASGRVYDRDGIIAELRAGDGAGARAFDFAAVQLSADVVLLTYRTEAPSLRTSVWMRGADGTWRIRHHHGSRVG
jgi:ribonuclease HI